MVNFDQLIKSRYSCRRFTEKPLTDEELKELIHAANGNMRIMSFLNCRMILNH